MTVTTKVLVGVGIMAVLAGAIAGGSVALDGSSGNAATPQTAHAIPSQQAPSEGLPAGTAATDSNTTPPAAETPILVTDSPARISRSAAPRRAAVPTVTTERTVSIREEIDLLDRAREALARGKYELALTLLDRYSSRYPQGELREEANAVRIEVRRQQQVSSSPHR